MNINSQHSALSSSLLSAASEHGDSRFGSSSCLLATSREVHIFFKYNCPILIFNIASNHYVQDALYRRRSRLRLHRSLHSDRRPIL